MTLSATGRRQISYAAEGRRSLRLALGCISPTPYAWVWVLDGGHVAYVMRGCGLSVLYASSPRVLMAVLPSAVNAEGGNEGAAWILVE